MALSSKDLDRIGEVVDSKINDLRIDMNKGFGLLRLEMNQRFDNMDQKIENVNQELKQEIRDINQMESEDIQMIYADITKIKRKVGIK